MVLWLCGLTLQGKSTGGGRQKASGRGKQEFGQIPRLSPAQRAVVSHLVKVFAEQSSGLGGGEVAELGHEVHLALGQQAGRGPEDSLPARDGLILVLDGCIQSLNCLIQLEKDPFFLPEQSCSYSAAKRSLRLALP